MNKASVGRAVHAFARGSLWIVVLVPILGVSAYSFFYVGRHFGVPWYIAAAISTCFDGVALLAADYSVKYAQEGLSGSVPRAVVRLFAVVGAFLQTFHARLGHEPPGGWVLWASLPIGAVLVYEIHLRWARRTALARAGATYPAPLPSFGLMTWLLFPLTTLSKLRLIVERRRAILVAKAEALAAKLEGENVKVLGSTLVGGEEYVVLDSDDLASDSEAGQTHTIRTQHARRPSRAKRAGKRNELADRRAKTVAMRAWGKTHGWPNIGDFGRVPGPLEDAYDKAMAAGTGHDEPAEASGP
jgi:Protein of unknown function (DUF2637)